ncbi:MAG: hypothetical protein UY05_C0027G0003 [Candidatus Peregrinibacteria bacterium GW2011_GWA2_47_7]|nr:MAG: hypothetical protein UY05_C0027G0003 [Candidatus Peregrinibacteria bacterium GW2011_GWA2_47_7]
MNNPAKKIILAVLSIVLVTATLFADQRLTRADNEDTSLALRVADHGDDAVFTHQGNVYALQAGAKARLTAVIGESVVVRLEPGSKATVSLPYDLSQSVMHVSLSSGRVWINSLHSTLITTLTTAATTITADPGIFDISYKAAQITVTSYNRSAKIEFLNNNLVVPENRSLTVEGAKLNGNRATIAKLRYSKLYKEFPYTAVPAPDDWVTKNQNDDRAFADAYMQKVTNAIREGGPKVSVNQSGVLFQVASAAKTITRALTLDPARKNKTYIRAALAYFDAALYSALAGDNDVSKRWLDEFSTLASGIPSSDEWTRELAVRAARTSSTLSGDAFFNAHETVNALLVHTPLERIHAQFNNVLDVAASGNDTETQARVVTALRQLGAVAKDNLVQMGGADAATGVFFESVLVNDFLNRTPRLLREEFLKIAELFESTHLRLLSKGEFSDDQKQFFMGEKINRIKVVHGLMEKDDVSFKEGRSAILLLADQIDALRPTTDTAVLSYFDNQLKEQSQFIAFLRSSDADNVHENFQESFAQFTANVADIKKVNDLLSSSTGGTQISLFRREELAQIVNTDIATTGLTQIKLVLPEDEGVDIVTLQSANFQGTTVSASYDTVHKVFSNITFGKEQIWKRADWKFNPS